MNILIFEKIRGIISSTLNIDPELVDEDLHVGKIPEWDSMGNLAIINALEEQFGVEFPIEDLFDLNSVSAIINEIEKLS